MKQMKRWMLAAIIAIGSTTAVNAQQITKVGHATLTLNGHEVTCVDWDTEPGTAEHNRRAAEAEGLYDKGTNALCDIWYFSYQYPSLSATGEEVTLTALAAMPDDNQNTTQVNNVIIGCHITMTSNKQCPTQFKATGSMLTDVFLLMSHAGDGLFTKAKEDNQAYRNLVILPDYEGYGVTKDKAHPYLCEDITARQVTDATRYGLQLYKTDPQVAAVRLPFREGWRTICEGYSQGGAVALATQKYMEQQGLTDELQLAGSICGGGPYDPIATFLYYIACDQAGQHLSLPVVLPLILKGLCDYNPHLTNHQVSDYMEERFLETGILDWLAAKEKTSDEIAAALKSLYENGKDGDPTYFREVLASDGTAKLSNIMKPETYNYFHTLLEQHPNYATTGVPLPTGNSTTEDLHLALEDNNLTSGWTPEHPVCLYHSTADDVVPYQNCERAQTAFGTHVKFYASPNNGSHGDTGTEFFTCKEREDAINYLAAQPVHPYDDPATTIQSTVHPQASTAQWHDLQGRRINGKPTTKGIYIHQGKKVAIQ